MTPQERLAYARSGVIEIVYVVVEDQHRNLAFKTESDANNYASQKGLPSSSVYKVELPSSAKGSLCITNPRTNRSMSFIIGRRVGMAARKVISQVLENRTRRISRAARKRVNLWGVTSATPDLEVINAGINLIKDGELQAGLGRKCDNTLLDFL